MVWRTPNPEKERNLTCRIYSALKVPTCEQFVSDNPEAFGADIRTSDDGTTTLHHSPNVGFMGTVKPLLDQGADIQAADKKEDTALHQFGVRGTHAATWSIPNSGRTRCTARW